MTVIGKITISFVVFASVSLLSMIMSFDGLNDIKRAISRVSVVEEPISAAIYEMQIKISGSSVATENTGPMNPTDWASTPVSVSLARPRA